MFRRLRCALMFRFIGLTVLYVIENASMVLLHHLGVVYRVLDCCVVLNFTWFYNLVNFVVIGSELRRIVGELFNLIILPSRSNPVLHLSFKLINHSLLFIAVTLYIFQHFKALNVFVIVLMRYISYLFIELKTRTNLIFWCDGVLFFGNCLLK